MDRKIAPAFLIALTLAGPAHAAAGDTVADRVLGQRRLSTFVPFFVDGRIFGATDVAVDRSATPNRVYLADGDLNRVLGWSDIQRFRAGAAADLVLGQPSLFTGTYIVESDKHCLAPSATAFCRPTRVAVDPRGHLYVADTLNYRVLEFDDPFRADRVADRVFGQPGFTSRRHAADTAFFHMDVAVDGAGNVWMVDPGQSRRILEFDDPLTHDTRADRTIQPPALNACAGTGQRAACFPSGLEVSPQGDLYVQDYNASLYIYRRPLTTDLASDIQVSQLLPGMAFDPAGNLYFVSNGSVLRLAAPIGPESFPEVLFQSSAGSPSGLLAIDRAGSLYVADSSFDFGGPVYVYDAPFRSAPAKIERPRISSRGLSSPNAVAVDRGAQPNRLYVLDATLRILGWRDAAGFASGAPADLVLDPGLSLNAAFATRGLAVDSRGNLWISDTGNHRVLELDRPFETDGVPDRVLGQRGSFTSRVCNLGGVGPRSLCNPGGLAFDRQDNLYVADLDNQRVLLFRDPLRQGDTADQVFGQADFRQRSCNRGSGRPGPGTLCLAIDQSTPVPHLDVGSGALAVDGDGNLYVGDSLNTRVLIFRDPLTTDPLADAVLGQDGSFARALRGTGPERFGASIGGSIFGVLAIGGLAIGPRGELYVADTTNDRLLVFEQPLKDDRADRVFGHPDFAAGGAVPTGFSDYFPLPDAARLFRPTGLAFDDLGNLYVADTGYNRVLAFDRP